MTPETLPTIMLMAFIFGSFLVLRIRDSIIGFVYAVMVIGITAANFTNSNIVFSPYLQFFTLIMAVLVLIQVIEIERG